MHTFETRHAEFEGFSEFFDSEIRPVLADRDSERQKAVRLGLFWGTILALVCVAGGFVVWHRLEETGIGLAIMTGGAALVATLSFMGFTGKIRQETKGRIVSAVVGFVGWTFKPDVPAFSTDVFQSLFLLPKRIDRSSFEDELSGQAHGASFRSVEAKLEKRTRDSRGRTKWTTLFRGQLMTLDFPTKTFGRTIVLRDRGWFNPKKRSDMKRIGLVDPVFEKIFEAYGTDQIEGRVILDPVFMQRMVDLEKAISGRKIRFGFNDDRLYIAVETNDQYEAGSMFKSLTDPKRTQTILDEVGAIFDIVDLLLDRPETRLYS